MEEVIVIRCQSCGMPLGPGFFGTLMDNSETDEYCKFCFQKGEFTQPDLTVDEMINLSIDTMLNDLKMPPQQAEQLARSVIPSLKRWQNQSKS